MNEPASGKEIYEVKADLIKEMYQIKTDLIKWMIGLHLGFSALTITAISLILKH